MSDARFPSLRPVFVLSFAAILLSACAPGRIDYRFIESAYDGQQDHWVPYSSSLSADVSGNPFPIPQDDFNKAVNAAIQPDGYPPIDTSAYRVRMIFNGPSTNGNYICQDRGDHGSQVGKNNGGTITIAASYCRGTDSMTFLQGSVSNISGPDDPRLKEFLRMVTVQLFPQPENTFGGPNPFSQ